MNTDAIREFIRSEVRLFKERYERCPTRIELIVSLELYERLAFPVKVFNAVVVPDATKHSGYYNVKVS